MTTMERESPSGPRSSSRNSRTSRPRSPTRARTATSHFVCRASIAISVDFPTPEPANRPRRCPSRHVVKAFITRTPRSRRGPRRARNVGSGGDARTGLGDTPRGRAPRPSIGRPSGSTTRPIHPSLTARLWPWPVAEFSPPAGWRPGSGIHATLPGPSPSVAANVIAWARPARNPTISAIKSRRVRDCSVIRSPTDACCDSPPTSTISPETPEIRPSSRMLPSSCTAANAASQRSATVMSCTVNTSRTSAFPAARRGSLREINKF